MAELKPRILVADDERNLRKNLALVLEEKGLDVLDHSERSVRKPPW